MACSYCGRRWFHSLDCPDLERGVWFVFGVLTLGFGAFLVAWAFGGGEPNLLIGFVLWGGAGVCALLLRRRRRRRSRENESS